MNQSNAVNRQRLAPHPVATVGAIILNSKNEALMIQTHKWSHKWGIPGGKIRFGESSTQALIRELKEETDLDIARIQFVLVQDCIQSDEFYLDAHFLLLNYVCQAPSDQPVRLNDEAQAFQWLPLRKALNLDLNQPTRLLIQALLSPPWSL